MNLWRQFQHKRAAKKKALRLLGELFSRPDLSSFSSLGPDQRHRAVLLDYETELSEVRRIRFGLVRHPKPVRLPVVFHAVIEIYTYDVEAGTVTVTASHNVTRKGPPRSP